MKPQYLSNIVVNRWKKSEGDRLNYALLTMSPTGIERFDQHGENQFEGKLEPGDIMLSDAMATSAAALSNHMGKYEGSIEGLKRLHTILGLEMGATVTGDTKYAKQGWKKKVIYRDGKHGFLSIYHVVYFSPTCNYYNNCFIIIIIIIIIITLQMRCELTFSNYCVLPVEVFI